MDVMSPCHNLEPSLVARDSSRLLSVKPNEWMHLSPFYTRMHGEWLRYAKSTSQFHWRFLLVRDVRGFQVNPLCRHDITSPFPPSGNGGYVRNLDVVQTKQFYQQPLSIYLNLYVCMSIYLFLSMYLFLYMYLVNLIIQSSTGYHSLPLYGKSSKSILPYRCMSVCVCVCVCVCVRACVRACASEENILRGAIDLNQVTKHCFKSQQNCAKPQTGKEALYKII